jgi:heptaprenylglyceryl phosphate synthase
VGVLRILGPSGDVTVTWNPEVDTDVEDVRRRFDEIIAEGYLVFELDAQTKEGTQVRTFDPQQRQLRAFRPMVGG